MLPRVPLRPRAARLLALGLLSLLACEEATEPETRVVVASVSVSSVGAPAVVVGGTLQLTAVARTATDSVVTGRPVEWSSNAPTIAVISAEGLVTALAVGTAVMSARVEGVTGTLTISVTPILVASVEVVPASLSMVVGSPAQTLTATPRSASGAALTGRVVTWSSDNSAIASVGPNGAVSGISPGTTTVRATSEGIAGTASVTVTPVPVATVVVTPPTATLRIGEQQALTVQAYSAGGALLPGRPVTWVSTAPAVATVSSGGTVTAVGEGVTLAIATIEGKADTAEITVIYPPGAWTDGALMTQARWTFSFGAIGDVITVGGGFVLAPSGGQQLHGVEAYSVPLNTWAARADRPSSQPNGASAVSGGRLYVFGGVDCCAVRGFVNSYDPGTDTWVGHDTMPTGGRADAVAGTIDSLIYVVGGRSGTGPVAVNEAYRPAQNAWIARAPMPTARTAPGAAVLNGQLYVVGGALVGGGYTGVVEVYDPATNSWSTRTAMPTPRQDLVVVALGGLLYAIGGYNGFPLPTVEMYDPAADRWRTLTPMSTARVAARGAAVGGRIIVIGGWTASSFGLRTVEIFTP